MAVLQRILITVGLVIVGVCPALARERVFGYCENGGQQVVVAGVSSTTYVQQSYVTAGGCTVSIYPVGASQIPANLAVIYADDSGTPKANPFTAAGDGYWFFYADTGRYDVRFSGGGIPTSFTRGDYTTGALADVYPFSGLPTAGIVGALASVTSGTRGVWLDTGTQWASLSGGMSDLRLFGATGNGTTDDTTAVQAAISAACATTPVGAVYMPSGNYKITTAITLCSGLTIRGAGWGSVLQVSGNSNGLVLTGTGTSTLSAVTLTDFALQKVLGSASSNVAIFATWTNDLVIDRVMVTNNGGVWGTAFECMDCNRLRLIDSQAIGTASNSVELTRSLSNVGTANQPIVTIPASGLTITYTSGNVYDTADHTITGNTLTATNSLNNCTAPTYASCNIIYWPGSGVSLAITSSLTTATAAGNILVGTITANGGNALAYTPFSGVGNAIIRGQYLRNGQGIDINAQQDYLVEGVTSSASSSTFGAGLVIEGASIRGAIIGNFLQNNVYYGMDFEPVNGDIDAVVLANVITGNGSGTIGGAAGQGIAVQTAGGVFLGNVIGYNESAALAFTGGTAPMVVANRFRQNDRGLSLDGAQQQSTVANLFVKNRLAIDWIGTAPSANTFFGNAYNNQSSANWVNPGASANGNGGLDLSPSNMRGLVTIAGGGTTGVVNTLSEPDANYTVVCSAEDQTGVPAAGSTRCYITGRSTTGFTVHTEVDPGGVATVTFAWVVVR